MPPTFAHAKNKPIDLQPFFAEYHSTKTHAFFFKDKATRQLKKLKNGHWFYQIHIYSLFAHIEESVEFEWRSQHIFPLTYRYERTGLSVKDRHASLIFDWENMEVTNRVQASEWKMAITDNTLDKLSYQLQLRLDLMQNKKNMHYLIADGGHLKQFIFKVADTVQLNTPMGKVTATIVNVVKKTGSYHNTKLWFAKEWGFLLTRMEQVDNDGEVTRVDLHHATVKGQRLE